MPISSRRGETRRAAVLIGLLLGSPACRQAAPLYATETLVDTSAAAPSDEQTPDVVSEGDLAADTDSDATISDVPVLDTFDVPPPPDAETGAQDTPEPPSCESLVGAWQAALTASRKVPCTTHAECFATVADPTICGCKRFVPLSADVTAVAEALAAATAAGCPVDPCKQCPKSTKAGVPAEAGVCVAGLCKNADEVECKALRTIELEAEAEVRKASGALPCSAAADCQHCYMLSGDLYQTVFHFGWAHVAVDLLYLMKLDVSFYGHCCCWADDAEPLMTPAPVCNAGKCVQASPPATLACPNPVTFGTYF